MNLVEEFPNHISFGMPLPSKKDELIIVENHVKKDKDKEDRNDRI